MDSTSPARLVHYRHAPEIGHLSSPENWPNQGIGEVKIVLGFTPPPELSNRNVTSLATIIEDEEGSDGDTIVSRNATDGDSIASRNDTDLDIDPSYETTPPPLPHPIRIERQHRNGYCCWKVIIPAVFCIGGAFLVGISFIPSNSSTVAIPEILCGIALLIFGVLGSYLALCRKNL